jgi:sec-independent protein translocase protein TatA
MLAYPLVIGMWEVIVIALVVLLLFGGKKVPELMKGIGKGVRSFKEGLNGTDDEDKGDTKKLDSGSSKPE